MRAGGAPAGAGPGPPRATALGGPAGRSPPVKVRRLIIVRLGAVGYLNARPLVHTLDRRDRFDVRFDVPSTCAALLHAGEIDVGMIPSIEYLRGSVPYEVVPDLGIVSDGPAASVAVLSRVV